MGGARPASLSGTHVALGVTGSIAAYKVVELARLCVTAGATVDVLMTEGATRFVTPLTFATLTQRRVWTTPYEPWSESEEGTASRTTWSPSPRSRRARRSSSHPR